MGDPTSQTGPHIQKKERWVRKTFKAELNYLKLRTNYITYQLQASDGWPLIGRNTSHEHMHNPTQSAGVADHFNEDEAVTHITFIEAFGKRKHRRKTEPSQVDPPCTFATLVIFLQKCGTKIPKFNL